MTHSEDKTVKTRWIGEDFWRNLSNNNIIFIFYHRNFVIDVIVSENKFKKYV